VAVIPSTGQEFRGIPVRILHCYDIHKPLGDTTPAVKKQILVCIVLLWSFQVSNQIHKQMSIRGHVKGASPMALPTTPSINHHCLQQTGEPMHSLEQPAVGWRLSAGIGLRCRGDAPCVTVTVTKESKTTMHIFITFLFTFVLFYFLELSHNSHNNLYNL
jgi:hypothetical protein